MCGEEPPLPANLMIQPSWANPDNRINSKPKSRVWCEAVKGLRVGVRWLEPGCCSPFLTAASLEGGVPFKPPPQPFPPIHASAGLAAQTQPGTRQSGVAHV